MIRTIVILLMLIFSGKSIAQKIVSQHYYEGVIGQNINIQLYLVIRENECGGENIAFGYYKYVKQDERILLNVFFSEKEQNFTMVEQPNTGILILNRKPKTMEGLWISSNGKTQHKVLLKEIPQTPKNFETMENHLEQLNHEAHDC